MKVYVILQPEEDNGEKTVHAVFSTRELAEKYVQKWNKIHICCILSKYDIFHMELDHPDNIKLINNPY